MKRGKLSVLTLSKHLQCSILLFSMILTQSLLFGTILLYQQTADGSLTEHDITLTRPWYDLIAKADQLSYWHGKSNEAWSWHDKKAYAGRVIFQGEADTEITVTNLGPLPTHTNKEGNTPNPGKFYWTQIASGSKPATDWTEYFLVLRPKGHTHEEKEDNYTTNTGIEHSGQTITITRSAGPSDVKATVGEIGYDKKGKAGTYTGNNAYEYKYQYRAIFIDVTLIPNAVRSRNASKNWTDERRDPIIYRELPQTGWYETNVFFSTSDGESLQLMFQSRYETPDPPPPNPACIFSITELLPGPVPYSILENSHTSSATALDVASLSYSSTTCQAVIAIRSDPAIPGSVDFGFRATPTSPIAIAHQLVYSCTIGKAGECDGRTVISNEKNFFYTHYDEDGPPNPMGGTLGGGHYLEGTVSLFIDPNTSPPLSGSYTSTIYVLIERYQ